MLGVWEPSVGNESTSPTPDREAIRKAKERLGNDRFLQLGDLSFWNRVIAGKVKSSPKLHEYRRLLKITDGEPPYNEMEREAVRHFRRAVQAAKHRMNETLAEIEEIAIRLEYARDVEEKRVHPTGLNSPDRGDH
jgi:hypothetical protein